MASWTNLIDEDAEYIVTANDWNILFGPSGNMQYIKDRADYLVTSNQKQFNASTVTIQFAWPQGNSQNISSMGTIQYPTWHLSGFPQNQYITFNDIGKYLCVLQANINVEFARASLITELHYYTIKTLISDTLGNLNITHLTQTGFSYYVIPNVYYDDFGESANMKFQVIFVLDVPFPTDLLIGYVGQVNYDVDPVSGAPYYFPKFEEEFGIYYNSYNVYLDSYLNVFKIPTYADAIIPSTSFILNTTTLNGTSTF